MADIVEIRVFKQRSIRLIFPNVQNMSRAFQQSNCRHTAPPLKCSSSDVSMHHLPIFHMVKPHVSAWACVQLRDGAYQLHITFRAVSSSDMMWNSRYSQQQDSGSIPVLTVISPISRVPQGGRKYWKFILIISPKSRSLCFFLTWSRCLWIEFVNQLEQSPTHRHFQSGR